MNSKIKYLVLCSLIGLCSCDDLFEPAKENIKDVSSMYDEATYADGILGDAYILLPYSSGVTSDVATDDAVTNDNSDSYRTMAIGSWTSQNDPMSQWRNRYAAIQFLNIFIENADNVAWSRDGGVRAMFNNRLKGEAYGLRALQMLYLLQAHGGVSVDGELLGVPVYEMSLDGSSDFNIPRASFAACIRKVFEDADMAIGLLPLDFGDIADISQIPDRYVELGVQPDEYNRVFGNQVSGRMSGRIAEAIKAQAALLAASPAFNQASGVDWSDAADICASVLDRIGGPAGLDPQGHLWYLPDNVDRLAAGANPDEIIWRASIGDADNTLEAANFPPSLRGTGRVNPTQNLVDAFPTLSGYPITDSRGGYDSDAPYENRDPRLSAYVVFNGATQGVNDDEIVTAVYGTNNDAINREDGHSTRTGYYMRKLLREDCNPHPTYNTKQKHYVKRIRYTEIFLAYAEAANEAWGPLSGGSHGYTAYDVIKAIRHRAGIGVDNDDAYLESIKSDRDKMRELIRNERRIELCFENIRFWDLRRWKAPLNENACGVNITAENGTMKYSRIEVEARNYRDYMYYGPIPYSELLKFGALRQNQGW